jgi:hypothetical protein
VTTGESLLGSSLNVDRNPMEVRGRPQGCPRTPAPNRLRPVPAKRALERVPMQTERNARRTTEGSRCPHGRRAAASIAGSSPWFPRKNRGRNRQERRANRPGRRFARTSAPADATGKTSKGNEAHGRSGSRDSGNGARETPDPQVEQRLEADAKARSGDELRIRQRTAGRNRTRSEGTARRQRSRQRDTATGGETSSRGVKRAAGNACSRVPDDSFASHEDRMPAGNAVNPRIGSGMQQARDSEGGENRRGGAKPRGRNGIRGWLPRTEARPAMVEREWTPAEHVDGGEGRSDATGTREPTGRSGNRSIRRSHLEMRTAASGAVVHRAEPSGRHTGDSSSRSTERVPQHRFRPMLCGTGVIPRRPAP